MDEDPPSEWGRLESAIISSFRHFRDRYLPSVRRRSSEPGSAVQERAAHGVDISALQSLPVDMQLYIMSFISPRDLCQLGCTSNYWYLMVRDAVLWRYFLLRDLPSWSSIDWNSLPSADILKTSCSESNDGMLHDYMAIYLKSCPGSRKSLKSNRPMYGAVTSFLHSLVVNAEPRFAMFGPGLEQLDDSLVRSMMTSPELLPVAGFPQRQIDGIGSGVTFQCNNHKLNILTLYSTTSKERARARAGENAAVNKMFIPENITSENQHSVHYNIIPQVQEVCRVVDGFIYVANAEMHAKHERLEEIAHISAMTDPALGSPSRPFLMLSCISRAGIRRIPSIYMAHELCLDRLNRPWMGTAAANNISATPTFLFFRNKVKVDHYQGADAAGLEEKIKQHLENDPGNNEDADIPKGYMDLMPFISKAGCECLNESDDNGFENCLCKDQTYLESDCDEQLLMTVAFNQPVKLYSMKLHGPDNGQGPRNIKIFINLPRSIDFDEAMKCEPTQALQLDPDDIKEDGIVQLRYVKFQNVNSVTLFVHSNQGDEETTKITYFTFIGTPVQATNMSDFKRVVGKKGESH